MKRTNVDYSKHVVTETKSDGLLVHHFGEPSTSCNSMTFINTNGIMAVTGDFGNWIFCREFHPSPTGRVSDGYWHEKLRNSSTQDGTVYDSDATQIAVQAEIDGGYADYGYTGTELEEMIEYGKECLELVHDKYAYELFAHREMPHGDIESVSCVYKTHVWLEYIFDGFDEICLRMKENLTEI